MTPTIHWYHPGDPERRTCAVQITVGVRTWYFSYDDCVAYRQERDDTVGPLCVRRETVTLTTERHLRYMGAALWNRVDDPTFDRLATQGMG